jgi:hypothetical protein
MKFIILLAAGIFLFSGCGETDVKEEDTTDFKKLGWILGVWEGKQGDADIYESWRRKNYRIMEGTSYTTSEGSRVFSQNMRIEQSNNIINYIILDENGEGIQKFQLTSLEDSTAEFTNAEEGYPDKIIYKREKQNRMNVSLLGEKEDQTAKSELNYRKTQDYSDDQAENPNP